MQFPVWTRRRGMTKKEQASARLAYLINRLCAEHSRKNSLKAVADAVGVTYSVILIYIGRGKFSQVLAEKFQKTFAIEPAWLTDPLSIPDNSK